MFYSLSPKIHALFAQQTGVQIEYRKILAPIDGFSQVAQNNKVPNKTPSNPQNKPQKPKEIPQEKSKNIAPKDTNLKSQSKSQ